MVCLYWKYMSVGSIKNGVLIPTYGSGVRSPGDITPALLNTFNRGIYSTSFLNKAYSNRSKSCNDKCELFKDNNRIFGVVDQSNKKALEKMADVDSKIQI